MDALSAMDVPAAFAQGRRPDGGWWCSQDTGNKPEQGEERRQGLPGAGPGGASGSQEGIQSVGAAPGLEGVLVALGEPRSCTAPRALLWRHTENLRMQINPPHAVCVRSLPVMCVDLTPENQPPLRCPEDRRACMPGVCTLPASLAGGLD